MLIRNISEDKAINLLREWNGQLSGGKTAESEKAFRAMCDRYVYVEVENNQELARLNAMDKYLTSGHGFFLYVRYPADVLESIRAGRAALPEFVHRAEQRYSSAYNKGSLKMLLGFIQESLDPYFDTGLFIDIMDEQKKAKQREEAARRAMYYQPAQQTYQPPAQVSGQPARQEAYQAPAQPQQPVQQPERRATNVVHYHFGNEVS